jgi:hypothetical protein
MTGMRNLMRPRHDLKPGELEEPGDPVELRADVVLGEAVDDMPASLQPTPRETLGTPRNRRHTDHQKGPVMLSSGPVSMPDEPTASISTRWAS